MSLKHFLSPLYLKLVQSGGGRSLNLHTGSVVPLILPLLPVSASRGTDVKEQNTAVAPTPATGAGRVPSVVWAWVAAPVSELAGGRDPLAELRRVRRLTEPRQSRDAGWDIDRLEPEGSCRTGRHCQRLCYHHRLPASEGGRGLRGWGAGGGEGLSGRES